MVEKKKSKYDYLLPELEALYASGVTSPFNAATELKSRHPDLKSPQGNKDYFTLWVRRRFKSWQKENKTQKASHAKVLLFDLETAPMVSYIWSKWQRGVRDEQIISDWFLICWSAKWLFGNEIYNACLTPKEILKREDERIVKSLWALIDEADIIIAHNLNRFDEKRSNTRFIKHGLSLPSPYERIDTLIHARRKFAITSNRLDYIAKDFIGIAGKTETRRGLWEDCMIGDKEALKDMQTYCDQDIRVLEDVYLWLRPYIQPHPNMGLHITSNKAHCPTCGSSDLTWKGKYRTYVNEFDAFKCNSCGANGRARKNSTPKQVRDRLLVALPR